MKKLLLIDGNSMLFRAYYATIYGQSMSSSQGIPTNAIYGFALMFSKAISVINPDYVLVAFDHSKETYRHKEYAGYKATRSATPEDLKAQFPLIRDYLDALHVVHYEQKGLEADDIIGCLAKNSPEYQVSILTSDKDLLQLVDDKITVYLMHKGLSDIETMNPEGVYQRFNLQPKQIIDLKGLAGDNSDNIPGVNKIGDKTAIKLINQYGSIENLYEHIDEIKGKLQENLINDKQQAFFSKHLATIITDEKIDIDLNDCLYQPEGKDAYDFYLKYDMKSLAKKIDVKPVSNYKEVKFSSVSAIDKNQLTDDSLIYIKEDSVHVINDKIAYRMSFNEFLKNEKLLAYLNSDISKYVYDLKNIYHLADKHHFSIKGKINDLMIIAFLTDSKLKGLEELFNKYNLSLENKQMDLFGGGNNDDEIVGKLYYLKNQLMEELKNKEMLELYYKIELPLVEVLASMEIQGIKVQEEILDKVAKETSEKMDALEKNIHQLAGKQFNVNSPKQLSEVLYDDLKIARSNKKSTDAKYLSKYIDTHPIINEILEYRKYAKIYSTYANGLKKYIDADGKIHTAYNQCITETGRLSSSDPNLQNISIRNQEASIIRAAFVADEGCVLVGADYSQVELRMLAHLANETNLINAFKAGMDIHAATAMEVFGVSQDEVTPLMRRQAKAINFGIDYGMSAYGLSETLQIPVNLAAEFIQTYFQKYPAVKEYMNKTIEFCQKNGYVLTMFNRRRDIPEINAANYNLKEFGKRAAMNAPVQGSAADLIKIAMINVYKKLKERKLKAKLILQIHDELILNVPIEEKEEVMKLVEDEMENALELAVPLVAQASWGTNWLEVK